MFTLRDYQEDCVKTVLREFATNKAQLVQLPTGAGKTVILWHVLQALGKKALIVAPTRELTEQLEETGGLVVGKENVYRKVRGFWSKTKPYLVMTVSSAGSFYKHDYISEFDPDVLIVDEAHRSRASNLQKLIQWFRDRERLVLGLTATPERLDGKSLLTVYDKLTFKRSMVDLIERGHLCDVRCYRLQTTIKMPVGHISGGDLSIDVLRQLDTDDRNALIAKTYLENCRDKKTLMFCLTVEHAKRMAKILRDEGVKATPIYGAMKQDERKDVLKRFASGEIQCLCNCQLLTEGFDEPSIEALLIARPTRSKALFTQMIGRGVRLHPGKACCYVYNISDQMHDICSFNVLGNERTETWKGDDFRDGELLTQYEARQREIREQERLSLEDLEVALEELDLWETSEFDVRPAMEHQLINLEAWGVPILDELTVKQAAYLLMKTRMIDDNGACGRTYWEEWGKDIQSLHSVKGT